MEMKTFEQWFNEHHHTKMPKGTIDAGWFIDHGLPMIVECRCCGMTMALPSAFIDNECYTYCSSCKGND